MVNPCCCCQIVAIVISNSNSAVDDNMEVFLNGTSLGTINNSTSSTCTGRIFATATGPSCLNIAGGPLQFCDSGTCSFESLLTFSQTLLISGINTLQIKSTANNGNGNFGKVKVLCLSLIVTTYGITKTLLDTTYSAGSTNPPNVIPISNPNFTYP